MPHHYTIHRCSEQTALARQDLSCTYLAQNELDGILTIIIMIVNAVWCTGQDSASAVPGDPVLQVTLDLVPLLS